MPLPISYDTIFSVIATGIITFLITRWAIKKKQELSNEATVEIDRNITRVAGEIRGTPPLIQNINKANVTQTITILPNLKASPIVYRRNKNITSLRNPNRRRKEINRIEFTILRDFIDKEFKEMRWLEKNFRNALLLVNSLLPSGEYIDFEKLPPPQKEYIITLIGWFRIGRVTHLLIPRIKDIHKMELDDKEKWEVFSHYFNNIKAERDGSIVDVWGDKDISIYLDKVLVWKITQGIPEIIIESRGGENVPRAIEVANEFISKNENWDVWRVDFTMIETQANEDIFLENKRYVSKIFIELFDWKKHGIEKDEIKERNEKIDIYLDKVHSRCCKLVDEPLDFYKEKENRITVYEDMKKKLFENRFCLFYAEGKHTYPAIFLGSVFRYYNPNFDYICFIRSSESKVCIYIPFSVIPIERMISAAF